ncbi:pyruvate, phosphate dikinase [Patescibacteria group bacterium]
MQYIYAFKEGDRSMKDTLGGKGANLAEMTKLGIPVPQGFTITTDVCDLYFKEDGYPGGYNDSLEKYVGGLEEETGKQFGDKENPLLVSVRSGAAISMPGMMDTVLNLGINDDTIKGLIEKTGNKRFCYDAYRRFIQMFGNVVLDIDHDLFEHKLEGLKKEKNTANDVDLTEEDLERLVNEFKEIVKEQTGESFPEDPKKQLNMSIEAVFKSWHNQRAVTYRKLNNITGLRGTAVNVQTMVFGNMGENSGTGVAFTRDPSTGINEFYGEYLMNAQGEDVVAGIRTPNEIKMLQDQMPVIYDELLNIRKNLEDHYKEMQDVEFTIEEGKLYMLQTRNGKRTAAAALKIAVDMFNEGLITKDEALMRIDPDQLNHLLHPMLDPDAEKNVIAKGLPASPGAAVGKVVFTADEAYEWANEKDEKVILVRKETSPEDIHGMHAAQGILTSTGGMTSHAAVVARGMGTSCVAGCGEVIVDAQAKKFTVGDVTVNESEFITLDGSTGEVILGQVPTIKPELTRDFQEILNWAKDVKTLGVRTNADTPHDSKVAREFGAEGIGLCRTEHMFFDEARIKSVREMILSKDEAGRRTALAKLKPHQKEDFAGIYRAMDGLPVTIRLLDPPLHEFLPQKEEHIEELANEMGVPAEELKAKVASLHEMNPMLGHRGCRLGLTYPEIYEMQVQAIIEAGIEVSKDGIVPIPEIEIPLVSTIKEFERLRVRLEKVIDEYRGQIKFEYKIGTMIETPRAALIADQIAETADFMSFGTNDLTQMTYGFSRDDIGKFLPVYLDTCILEADPFETIDQEGVGQLMKMTVEKGKEVNPHIDVAICGEQGGEPKSVEFCHNIGLDYVSCSPFRVPIAVLSAAQAKIKAEL